MTTELEKAIDYVRKNKSWSKEEEIVALRIIDQMRCDIDQADEDIADEIHDLMEEYSEENGLPEEWWMYETDVDEIFFKL